MSRAENAAGEVLHGAFLSATESNVAPSMKASATGGGGTPANTTVNQSFNFQHEGKNAHDIGKHANHGVKQAIKQTPQGEAS